MTRGCGTVSTSLLLLLAGAGQLVGQDPVALPRPKARRVAPDDAARGELQQRLCAAVDAKDFDAVSRALVDGALPDLGVGSGSDDTAQRTPLIHAVVAGSEAAVDALVAAGARLEQGDAAGHTPLMYAALVDSLPMAQQLLRLGARTDVVDASQTAAVGYATKSKELAGLLAAAGPRNEALLEAIGAGELEIAKRIVAEGASPNANDGKVALLAWLVRRDDLEAVKWALGAGARAGLQLVDGFTVETPLSIAAEHASLPVLQALLTDGNTGRPALGDALAAAAGVDRGDRKERVRLLLSAGADPSHGTLFRTPPLAAAATFGDFETMALLLGGGADLDAVDQALVHAAGGEDAARAEAVVRALLAVGANPDAELLFANALGSAAERGHTAVMELLCAKGTDDTLSAAVAQAARSGCAEGLRWLCEYGKGRIDFGYKPGLSDPALVAAIGKDCLECVDILLAAGASPDHAPSLSHDTPLATAVRGQKYEFVEKLLAAGADPTRSWEAPLRPAQTALDMAQELDDARLLSMLRAAKEVRDRSRDPLGRALAESGLRFTESKSSYEVRFTSSDTARHHTVHVRKTVDEYLAERVQEVFGLVYDEPEKPEAELLRATFRRTFGIGGLVLERPGDAQRNWRIRFRIEVPVETTPERLLTYLQIVHSTADDLEKTIRPDAEDKL